MNTTSISSQSLWFADKLVGVEEQPKGSNSGPQVNAFLKSVGLPPGEPWCMAFVYYCVSNACHQLNLPCPLIETGGVMDQWERTQARKMPNRDSAVKPGDVFIMRFAHGTGHTGFVELVKGGLIQTIEGNTNEDGSREGYEVARRSRPISSIFGFIQIP